MGKVNVFEVLGDPPPWSVVSVDKFVVSVLRRLERDGVQLPEQFRFSLCPWGERNAIGGTPSVVKDGADPRCRVVHFTGCSKPYLVAVFTGDDAARRQELAMHHLPWSEHYQVELRDGIARLGYLDCMEEVEEPEDEPAVRTLYELARSGELAEL